MTQIYLPEHHLSRSEKNILKDEECLGAIIGHYALQAEKINGQSYFKKVGLYYNSDPDSEEDDKNATKLNDLAIWSDGHNKWFIGDDHLKKEKYK